VVIRLKVKNNRLNGVVVLLICLTLIAIVIGFYKFNAIPEGNQETLNENNKMAKVFLEEKGYNVLEYIGSSQIYYHRGTVSFNDIKKLALIDLNYENLLDKPLTVEGYLVTNHPLDSSIKRLYETIKSGLTYQFKVIYPNMTRVYIVKCEDQVLGGYSLVCHQGMMLLGSQVYTIDGKTIEEKSDLTYDEWRDSVIKKMVN